MEKQMHRDGNDMGTLTENARALMIATADVAGEKVGEARKRLAAALESGKELYGSVRDKTVEKAMAVDETVREHPYHTMGLAFAAGVLIGVLVTRRYSRSDRE